MKKLVNGVEVEMSAEEAAALQAEWDAARSPTAVLARKWAAVREERNRRLNASDWTQLADVIEATRLKWAIYRQALRDVPQQHTDPDNITWPKAPA